MTTTFEYSGINSFMIGMSKILLDEGIERKTRGQIAWELPEPIIVKITNPKSRLITVPCRGWNVFLSYAESLWLASGRNDLQFIQHYLKNMQNFSDDGQYIRAGYGPRFRSFDGNLSDYEKSIHHSVSYNKEKCIDQFSYIVESFQRDPWTRQGVITIGDPLKDCFNHSGSIKQTRDYPCTRLLQFMRKANTTKLDLTVYMRSNDFFWGATGVNIFNYTFIQEYMAAILGLEVGTYYHMINNLHYYIDSKEKLEKLASIVTVEDNSFEYEKLPISLSDFDKQVYELALWEEKIRKKKTMELKTFDNDFFNDWAKVFFFKNTKSRIDFSHPMLNKIMNEMTSYTPQLFGSP